MVDLTFLMQFQLRIPPCVHQSWLVILSLVKPTRNVEGTRKPLFFFKYLEGPSKGLKHGDLLVVLHSDATKFADIGRL